MTTLQDKLRELYRATGANYVQWAADRLDVLEAQVAARELKQHLYDYVNDAKISGEDAPHVVVDKLQKAIDASAGDVCKYDPVQQDVKDAPIPQSVIFMCKQRFLEWNRSQRVPPISGSHEYFVFENAIRCLTEAKAISAQGGAQE